MSHLLSAGSDSRFVPSPKGPGSEGGVALGVLVQGVSQAALKEGPSIVLPSLQEP